MCVCVFEMWIQRIHSKSRQKQFFNCSIADSILPETSRYPLSEHPTYSHSLARKSTLFRRAGHLGTRSHLGETDDNEELDERNEHDVVELKVDVSDTWRKGESWNICPILIYILIDILGEKMIENLLNVEGVDC